MVVMKMVMMVVVVMVVMMVVMIFKWASWGVADLFLLLVNNTLISLETRPVLLDYLQLLCSLPLIW